MRGVLICDLSTQLLYHGIGLELQMAVLVY